MIDEVDSKIAKQRENNIFFFSISIKFLSQKGTGNHTLLIVINVVWSLLSIQHITREDENQEVQSCRRVLITMDSKIKRSFDRTLSENSPELLGVTI